MKKKIILIACALAIFLASLPIHAWEPKKVSMEEIQKYVMSKSSWKEEEKVSVINFVTSVKNAYENKDSAFLDSTFRKEDYIPNYKIQVKDAYIAKLKDCFKSNHPVKMQIYGYHISKLGGGGSTFSISLCIEYKCKKVKERGYLFGILDVNIPQKPCIRLWVWQKERDPKINDQFPPDDYLYGLFYGGLF